MKRAMLETVEGVPPNFAAIVAALPDADKPGVIFAYGGKVYGRGIGKHLTRELDAHERVHIERQGDDPDGWWAKYLSNPEFRYVEELLAHRAEYETYCRRHINPAKRMMFLRSVASRLASSLYGLGVAYAKAMSDLQAG